MLASGLRSWLHNKEDRKGAKSDNDGKIPEQEHEVLKNVPVLSALKAVCMGDEELNPDQLQDEEQRDDGKIPIAKQEQEEENPVLKNVPVLPCDESSEAVEVVCSGDEELDSEEQRDDVSVPACGDGGQEEQQVHVAVGLKTVWLQGQQIRVAVDLKTVRLVEEQQVRVAVELKTVVRLEEQQVCVELKTVPLEDDEGDMKLKQGQAAVAEAAATTATAAAAGCADHGVCSFESKWMRLEREIQVVDQEHKAFVSEFLEVAQVQRRRSLLLDRVSNSAVSALRGQLQREAMAFSLTYVDSIDAAEDYLSFFHITVLDRLGKYMREDPRVLEELATTLKATRVKTGIRRGGDFDKIRERRKSVRSKAWRLLRDLHRRSPAGVDAYIGGALKPMRDLEGCMAKRREEIAGLRQKLKNIDEMLDRARKLGKRAVPTNVEVKIVGKERVQKREETVRIRSKSKILPEETIPNLIAHGKTERLREQPIREQDPVRGKYKDLEDRIEKEVQLQKRQQRFKQAARELRKLCETLKKKNEKKTTKTPAEALPAIEEEDMFEEKKKTTKNRFLGKIRLSTFSCFSGG